MVWKIICAIFVSIFDSFWHFCGSFFCEIFRYRFDCFDLLSEAFGSKTSAKNNLHFHSIIFSILSDGSRNPLSFFLIHFIHTFGVKKGCSFAEMFSSIALFWLWSLFIDSEACAHPRTHTWYQCLKTHERQFFAVFEEN